MQQTATRIPYRQTNAFSRIITDYLDKTPALAPFYAHPLTPEGIGQAIAQRKKFNTPRSVLVATLQKQYADVVTTAATAANITALGAENTFTITTAHQNNIFTGPLYFIYKIVHVIRLAEEYNKKMPDNKFVPVYYIGSEDADLEELNHIQLRGKKLVWNTKQTGAVGRMKVDSDVQRMINEIEGQLSVLSHGVEIVSLLRQAYRTGISIEAATFEFVNALFGRFGLVVLCPDNAALKALLKPVFRDDLLRQTAAGIVQQTAAELTEAGYKVQAHARDINLFYLADGIRQRIETTGDEWRVVDTDTRFTEPELMQELEQHPDRFSPNVILRGLYQCTILPDIAFVGGGGETAYWFQLKKLFDHYKVPFPVLVLRNSFLLLEKKWEEKMQHLGLQVPDLFNGEEKLLNELVNRESNHELTLNGKLASTEELYQHIRGQVAAIDPTLANHVDALKTQTLRRLAELEKKMLRAEKRKFEDQRRQLHTLMEALFPGGGLQERKESFLYYYALLGPAFLDQLYSASLALEQEFVVLPV